MPKKQNSKAITKPIKTWSITEPTNQKTFEYATNMLRAFSRLQGYEYYLIDYYEEKLHFIDPSSIMLCGHSLKEAEKLGMEFYEKIVEPTEWEWVLEYNEKAFELFYSLDVARRKDITISYTLKLINTSGMETNTIHEITLIELDEKGNPWLVLARVVTSPDDHIHKAHVIDKKTGERWNFINGNFKKSKSTEVSQEEKQIIRYLVAGHSTEAICGFLDINRRTFSRWLDALYKKLGVSTKSALVHKAGRYGLV
jgi:DNA-binding CsgD family transcriptional regulator